jgi:hypothetical protein
VDSAALARPAAQVLPGAPDTGRQVSARQGVCGHDAIARGDRVLGGLAGAGLGDPGQLQTSPGSWELTSSVDFPSGPTFWSRYLAGPIDEIAVLDVAADIAGLIGRPTAADAAPDDRALKTNDRRDLLGESLGAHRLGIGVTLHRLVNERLVGDLAGLLNGVGLNLVLKLATTSIVSIHRFLHHRP